MNSLLKIFFFWGYQGIVYQDFFFKEQFEVLRNLAPNVDAGKLSQLLSCAHALVTQEAVNIGLPDFPLDNLSSAALIVVIL